MLSCIVELQETEILLWDFTVEAKSYKGKQFNTVVY